MDLRSQKYGIEIETIGATRETVARAIQAVVGGEARYTGGTYGTWEVEQPDGRIWKAVSDSSLTSVSRDFQAEVVSPILRYEDLEVLQQVVRAIRAAGAKVDQTTSIHIHIDAAPFDGRSLTRLAKLVYKQEPIIIKALGIQERRLRQYAKPMAQDFIARLEADRPQTTAQMNKIWYGHKNRFPNHYDSSRYHGVNFHNVWFRGTVEFRWFEGTLHAGRVKAYVQFVLALAAKGLNGRSASSQKRTYNEASAKYDFRVFLLGLGLIGDEFKTARLHLLANLPGNAAWKNGRPNTAA